MTSCCASIRCTRLLKVVEQFLLLGLIVNQPVYRAFKFKNIAREAYYPVASPHP